MIEDNELWENYECEGQMDIFEVMEEMSITKKKKTKKITYEDKIIPAQDDFMNPPEPLNYVPKGEECVPYVYKIREEGGEAEFFYILKYPQTTTLVHLIRIGENGSKGAIHELDKAIYTWEDMCEIISFMQETFKSVRHTKYLDENLLEMLEKMNEGVK